MMRKAGPFPQGPAFSLVCVSKLGHHGEKAGAPMNSGNCEWSRKNQLLRHYHDSEWGKPEHDDRRLFEHLTLEVMQCGLNWELMLKKREVFRRHFAGFAPERLALFTEADIEVALADREMIRSRRKIEAVAANAKAFLGIQKDFGSFDAWLWNFTQGRMLVYASHALAMPASNELSEHISRELKKRGFRFVGGVTVYSMLQACGIINDHDRNCPRFRAVMQDAEVEWRND